MTLGLREKFERDGYVVLEEFVSNTQCQTLVERALKMVREYRSTESLSIFTTDESRRRADDYFLNSSREMSFFFEDIAIKDGTLTVPPDHACNKIGHALHDLDPIFSEFSRTESLRVVSESLGLIDPLLIQSMFIFKNPQIGGRVDWHQDACFLYTDPVTVKGFWFALEDADRENGCLWVAPGCHTQGVQRRFMKDPTGDTYFVPEKASPLDIKDPIPLEVPAGTLVVFHGCLPHFSAANHSSKRRCAYTLHLIERTADYPKNNWLQETTARPFRGW